MNDFFDKRSNKDRLYTFIKEKKWVKTSDILRFGVENFSNRADRNARQLASEGKIRRMPETKKLHLFGPIREDVWELIRFPESCL